MSRRKVNVGLITLSFFFVFSAASASSLECEAGSDCPDGYFCYMAGYCVPCITCSDYNRRNSSNYKCPQKPPMCGKCLSGFQQVETLISNANQNKYIVNLKPTKPTTFIEGVYTYEEELLTQGEIRDICRKSPVAEKNEQPEESSKGYTMYWCLIGTGMFFCFAVFLWKNRSLKLRGDRGSIASSEDIELAPPPYDSCRQQAKIEEEQVSEPLVHEIHVATEKNTLQQARPFRPAYSDSGESETEMAESETGSHPPAEEELNDLLIDENTMPSDWTPTPQRPVEDAASVASYVDNDVAESQASSNSEEPRPKKVRRDNTCNGNNFIELKINNFFNISNSQS